MAQIKEYTHELNQEIRSISGGYELDTELRVPWGGRQVLCVLGNAKLDASCCGLWGCRYALIPGYVVEWKCGKRREGQFFSKVETIRDERTRQELTVLLQSKEGVSQVRFW
jgi:hypothetical protein